MAFLPFKKERYGLTTFRKVDQDRLGALCSPRALAVHDRVLSRLYARSSALLAQASQHLWLGAHHDVYQEFTSVHHTVHPAPSPPDAGRDTLPSRCRRQSRDCGYRVRGLCTGCYLPAHPRRILLMEQQVWSVHLARQSTLRPRVAVINGAKHSCSWMPCRTGGSITLKSNLDPWNHCTLPTHTPPSRAGIVRPRT
jgi:hypothetical protein